MYSWENPDDRVAIVQMNAELRHAQLELLSAQCATHQLRLRFTTEDLARFGQQDVLRKAIAAASGLREYYAAIEKQMPRPKNGLHAAASALIEERVAQASACVLALPARATRTLLLHGSAAACAGQGEACRPFFSPGILDRVRILELKGARLPNPAFYSDAQALGVEDLPPLAHMASLTFVDVVVFNDRMTERTLFHGLVHAAQMQVLGLDRYAELFVRGFLRTGSHVTVPSGGACLRFGFALRQGFRGLFPGRRAGAVVASGRPLLATSLVGWTRGRARYAVFSGLKIIPRLVFHSSPPPDGSSKCRWRTQPRSSTAGCALSHSPVHETLAHVRVHRKISDLKCGQVLEEMAALRRGHAKIAKSSLDNRPRSRDFVPFHRNSQPGIVRSPASHADQQIRARQSRSAWR